MPRLNASRSVQYPLALIPGILYHLTQMIMDTFVAEKFRKLSDDAHGRRHG